MSKELPLTNNLVAIVDDDVWDVVTKHSWCAGEKYYPHTRMKGAKVYLHRFIMKAEKGQSVDHINGNFLDCRRENMRICLHRENIRNKKKQEGNYSSKYKGVYYFRWGQRKRRWKSAIEVLKKVINLGYFLTEEEAAKAYDSAALEHYGKYACLNFPTESNPRNPFENAWK